MAANETATIVLDNQVIWLEVPKRGTPLVWQPGINYKLGDIVIPGVSTVIPVGKEDVMFQCVGFVAYSASSAPTWPVSAGTKVVDGTVEWTARDPSANPEQPASDEYAIIQRNITVSNS